MLLSRSLRVLVVGLCVVLGAATAFAAATLEVTVIGGSGRVTVVVTGPDGVAQTTNYNQQEFKVPVAGPAAAYEVSITVGDVTETTEIPLPAKGKVNVVFIVEPGPPRIEATTVAVETLTVTARRIEESLQEVPLSVSAVSGETLDEAGIDRMEEYLTRVRDELLRARQGLEELTGASVRLLCWPGGGRNAKVLEIAADVGYQATTTHYSDRVLHNVPPQDPRTINRIGSGSPWSWRGRVYRDTSAKLFLGLIESFAGIPGGGLRRRLAKLEHMVLASLGQLQ